MSDLAPWVPICEAALPPGQNGLLVHLSPSPAGHGAGLDLGVLPLDGLHPLDLLEGAVAPPAWLALGLVSRGWASPLDGARPSQHPARVAVVATVLADRSGAFVGRVVSEDGRVLVDEPPTEGEVPAALLAALLPSEPAAGWSCRCCSCAGTTVVDVATTRRVQRWFGSGSRWGGSS